MTEPQNNSKEDITGAEAVIIHGTWFGRDAIYKKRITKKYRVEQLDRKIRVSRMKHELKMIHNARLSGVTVPWIYDVDMFELTIVMEYINGKTLKEELENKNNAEHNLEELVKEIIKMHSNKIAHGDLTTSNVIVSNGKLVFIDFSLGTGRASIEELAVDIHMLKEVFLSAHEQYRELLDKLLLEYATSWNYGEEVIKKEIEISKRGRYT
ncbi:MAG: Kae1-associated serine/threonine protein kinase [Candidatus Thermoplasmatota archaeon]|nr:Kae1-associated serine/threonine protein kinase [Candidatus Thermoplasmatota archaeon]MCL5963475.1 Kae1-associated serine/threonine protein kinase [Candidatus Thermoplasmatota archaeon]